MTNENSNVNKAKIMPITQLELLESITDIHAKEDIRQYLWLFLKSALSSKAYDYKLEEPQEREDIIFFYEQLTELFDVD